MTSLTTDIPVFFSLEECVTHNEKLFNKIISLEAQIKALPSLREKLELLESQHRHKDQQIAGLESKLELCRELLESTNNEMVGLQLSLQKEIREKNDLTAANATLAQQLRARIAAYEELQGELDKANEKLEGNERERVRNAELVEEFERAAVTALQQANEEFEKQLQQRLLIADALCRCDLSDPSSIESLKTLLQDLERSS